MPSPRNFLNNIQQLHNTNHWKCIDVWKQTNIFRYDLLVVLRERLLFSIAHLKRRHGGLVPGDVIDAIRPVVVPGEHCAANETFHHLILECVAILLDEVLPATHEHITSTTEIFTDYLHFTVSMLFVCVLPVISNDIYRASSFHSVNEVNM